MKSMEYLNTNRMIAVRQSGYRFLHSTTTVLLKISDDIKRSSERGKTAIMLLLDFTKAFDSVDHELLCNKLRLKFDFDTTAVSVTKNREYRQCVSTESCRMSYL